MSETRTARSMSGREKDYQHLLARIEILESAVDKLRAATVVTGSGWLAPAGFDRESTE